MLELFETKTADTIPEAGCVARGVHGASPSTRTVGNHVACEPMNIEAA